MTLEWKPPAELHSANGRGPIDIRDMYPELFDVLGVNTDSEHDVIHGVLGLLVKRTLDGMTIEDLEQMLTGTETQLTANITITGEI
jgi:hypothetical protein